VPNFEQAQEESMSFSCNLSARVRKQLAGLALLSTGALMSFSTLAADARNDAYQKEREACLSGASHQDRQTCLREVGAARGEARRGNLTESQSYDSNASQRCNALPPADREDCIQRVRGGGTVSGSVEQGGIYRETRTTVIAEPPPPSPPPAYEPVPVVPPAAPR